MDDWTNARTTWLHSEAPAPHREAGLDARRRESSLARADAAHDKALTDDPPDRPAVVALRQDWARSKVVRLLEEKGYDVTGCDDGADALGITAALRPEILVCEEPLASVATPELVAWVTRLNPATRVVVQVQHPQDAGRALEAGAAAAVARSVPLEELVARAVR